MKLVKFKEGTKVIVFNELITTIEKVEWDKSLNDYKYFFKDKEGELWWETKSAFEIIG